jgi:hypothetical protein
MAGVEDSVNFGKPYSFTILNGIMPTHYDSSGIYAEYRGSDGTMAFKRTIAMPLVLATCAVLVNYPATKRWSVVTA